MIDRHIRQAGVRLIEAALRKVASGTIFNPTLSGLQGAKTRELNKPPPTASAEVPKILTLSTM